MLPGEGEVGSVCSYTIRLHLLSKSMSSRAKNSCFLICISFVLPLAKISVITINTYKSNLLPPFSLFGRILQWKHAGCCF